MLRLMPHLMPRGQEGRLTRKEYCSFGQLIPLPAQNYYLFLWVATTEQNQARKTLFSVPVRPIQGPPRRAVFLSYPDYSATAKAARKPEKKAPRTAEAAAAGPREVAA